MMARNRGVGACAESLETRRLLSGGLLDTTFGTNGFATATKSGFAFRSTDVAAVSQGKVIVAGLARSSSGHYFPAIARLNVNGSLDTTFPPDHSGVFISASEMPSNDNVSVAVQSDGKIVLATTEQLKISGRNVERAFVQRFNANGSVDASFHTPGRTFVELDPGFQAATNVGDVLIQRDGKVVLTGTTQVAGLLSGNDDAYVARFNSDGTLDHSFGNSGSIIIDQDNFSEGNTLAIDYNGSASSNPNFGKIIMGGDAQADGVGYRFFVARLSTSGHLDNSFHHNGKLASAFESEDLYSSVRAINILPNEKIIIAGEIGSNEGEDDDFGFIRLNKDGSGDSTFGPSNGQLDVDFGTNDGPMSMITSQTGELIVGGFTGGNTALVMIKTTGFVDTAFGPNGNGKVILSKAGAATRAAGMTLTLNGKFVTAGGDMFNSSRLTDRAFSTVSITAIAPNASETGPTPAAFTVSRAEVVNTTTRVLFQVSGTATSPFTLIKKFEDYTGITAPPPPGIGQPFFPPNTAYVDIPAGQRSVTFTITPIDDTRPEAAETAIFTLESRPEYDIAPGHGTAQATIKDNDSTNTGVTLGATADAFVRDGTNAAVNFGHATDLEVKKAGSGFNRVSYIKFDLSSVSAINSVTLNLFGKISDTQNANITTSIFSVADTSWSETGITFNNAPAASATALAGATVTGTTLQMVHVDLTAYVKAQFAAGHKVISFALKDAASSNSFVQFNSREAGSNTPQLIVT